MLSIMNSFASLLIATRRNVGFHEIKVDCSVGVAFQRIMKLYQFVETFTMSPPTLGLSALEWDRMRVGQENPKICLQDIHTWGRDMCLQCRNEEHP